MPRNSNRKRRPASQTPRIEYDCLEPRLALTTFFVDTLVDDASGSTDGSISLREAVIAANTNASFGDAPAGAADGDIIRFSSALQDGTIMFTNGELDVTDDLKIQAGSRNITLDAQNASRHFEVTTNEVVNFGQLDFVNGSAAIGGAISNVGGGTTVVFGGTFSNNEATGLGGGAIYTTVGQLFVSGGVDFIANEANGASGSGGAILSATGTTAIRGGTIAANVANRAGGGIEAIDGSVFLNDLTLGGESGADGNVAGPVGSASPGNGGGVHVTGSADVSLNNSSVENNYAAREGGGLWNQAGGTMRVANNSNVESNVAAGDASDDGGGGIFNNGGDIVVRNSTVIANTATGSSGSGGGVFSTAGMVTIVGSTIGQNSAARAGGGIEVVVGNLSVIDSTLSMNDAGINVAAAPGNGGAVHVTGSATTAFNNVDVTGNAAASEGGGLWNASNSDMFVRDSLLDTNIASGDAADNGGGGIFNNGGRVYVNNTDVTNNSANGASGSGGGAFSVDGVLRLDDSTVSNNTAIRAGGGVEVVDGNLRFTRTEVSGNDVGVTLTAAPGNGGGVHITGSQAILVSLDSEFSGNAAANQGGGIWNQSGSSVLLNAGTEVIGNSTTDSGSVGGGVYNLGYLRAIDSLFESNTAVEDGGGLFFAQNSQGRIQDTELRLNSSGDEGGAVFNAGQLVFEDSDFTSNVAGSDGGAIFTDVNGNSIFAGTNNFNLNVPNDQN